MSRAARQNDQNYAIGIDLDPSSNLMREGYTYEKYRVGCPPLQILPLQSISVGGDDEREAYSKIRCLDQQIRQIIERHDLYLDATESMHWGRCFDIELFHRALPNQEPSREDLTLVIPAVWDDEQPYRWLFVADELRGLMLQYPGTKPVRVEIVGGHYLLQQSIVDVEDDNPIIPIWDSIRPQVRSIILESPQLRDRWCSIGVLDMTDYHWNGCGPPLTTRLSVLVDWDVNPHEWEMTETRIKDLLSARDLSEVRVFFHRGEIQVAAPHQGEEIAYSSDYSQKVKMGADFGPAREFQTPDGTDVKGPSARFGGYLKVTDLRTGDIRRMGLTSWQNVRGVFPDFKFGLGPDSQVVKLDPPMNSELYRMDHHGMRPDYPEKQRLSQFESPTRRKHNSAMDDLTTRLAEKQAVVAESSSNPRAQEAAQKLQATYDRRKAFFDDGKQALGTLWAGSGFRERTQDKGRLDWALIEFSLQNRLGTNFIPDMEEDFPIGFAPNFGAQELKGVGSLEYPRNRHDVFAFRSGSKCMTGNIKRLKDDVNIHGMSESTEYCFMNRFVDATGSSAGSDDSGSMIFNDYGNFVGLVHTRPSSHIFNTGFMMYVTDAKALLQSMNGQYEGEYRFELP